MLDFQKLIEKAAAAPVPVPTPEWPEVDGKLFVRIISAEDRVRQSLLAFDADGKATPLYYAALAAVAACDETGAVVFADAAWLAKQDSRPVLRMHEAASQLNGMSLEAKRETEKN